MITMIDRLWFKNVRTHIKSWTLRYNDTLQYNVPLYKQARPDALFSEDEKKYDDWEAEPLLTSMI